jgi:hypothetical protein
MGCLLELWVPAWLARVECAPGANFIKLFSTNLDKIGFAEANKLSTFHLSLLNLKKIKNVFGFIDHKK